MFWLGTVTAAWNQSLGGEGMALASRGSRRRNPWSHSSLPLPPTSQTLPLSEAGRPALEPALGPALGTPRSCPDTSPAALPLRGGILAEVMGRQLAWRVCSQQTITRTAALPEHLLRYQASCEALPLMYL